MTCCPASRSTRPRQRGLELLNGLPANDRQFLLEHFARLDPADAEKYLTRLGRVDRKRSWNSRARREASCPIRAPRWPRT